MFAAFQTRVPASSPYERDPRVMPSWFVNGLNVNETGLQSVQTSAFWSHIDTIGDYITGDPSTATRTILDVTGRGRLVGVVGPNVAAGGTTTFTITVDGVEYTYAATPSSDGNQYRLCLGDFARWPTEATTANDIAGSNTTGTARVGNIVSKAYGGNLVVRSPVHATRFIKFDVSLKVQVSTTSTGSQTNSAYSGIIWNLDG